MKKYLMILFFLTACLFCQAACAEDVLTDLDLRFDGRAAVLRNDIARAREEAVKNALDKAILQAAAMLLGNKINDEKFQSMKNILLDRANQHIKNYRIVSEKNDRDEYIVSVSVLISQSSVRDDLISMNLLQDTHAAVKTPVVAVLTGVKNHSEFMRFMNFLKSRPQLVLSAYPCSLEWRKAQCDLVVSGDVQRLVSELEKTGAYVVGAPVKKQDGFEINLQIKEEIK